MYISYINLDSRPDRNSHMIAELNRVGLNAERTRAMLPQEYVGNPDKVRVMWIRSVSHGAVGCHYSQVKVMEEGLKRKEHTMVLEDDLIICSDIKVRLEYIQLFLDTHEWDIFFLGGTFHVKPPWWHKKGHSPDLQMCTCKLERDAERTDDPRIMRTYGAFSTHAYIVNVHSIEKILNYFDENVYLSMGIDWLFIKMQPELKAFAFVPGCIKQYDNKSDIGSGMTVFSGFATLNGTLKNSRYWWQDRMDEFDPETFDWAETKI